MRKKYSCYEPGWAGIYTEAETKHIYKNAIDKHEYPTYKDWIYDMLKSGIFVEVKRK